MIEIFAAPPSRTARSWGTSTCRVCPLPDMGHSERVCRSGPPPHTNPDEPLLTTPGSGHRDRQKFEAGKNAFGGDDISRPEMRVGDEVVHELNCRKRGDPVLENHIGKVIEIRGPFRVARVHSVQHDNEPPITVAVVRWPDGRESRHTPQSLLKIDWMS